MIPRLQNCQSAVRGRTHPELMGGCTHLELLSDGVWIDTVRPAKKALPRQNEPHSWAIIIRDVNLAQRVSSVQVRRKELEASIHWVKKGRAEFSYGASNSDLTVFEHPKEFVWHPFTLEADLRGTAISKIAAALSRSDT
jgi:hypothetical protein